MGIAQVSGLGSREKANTGLNHGWTRVHTDDRAMDLVESGERESPGEFVFIGGEENRKDLTTNAHEFTRRGGDEFVDACEVRRG